MYWVQVLHQLQNKIKSQSFNNWFKPTLQVYEDDERVKILIPSAFFRDVIERSYQHDIESSIRACNLPVKELEFITNDQWETFKNSRATTSLHPNLNPLYTFENFVEGSSNQSAYAAARAVSDHPGIVYNPIFIYGGVGLGKTHLLHAIGNFTYQKTPQFHVIYVSCDALMNHLVDAYRKGTVHEMRRFYRSSDLLLLDDIHTLGGKERTQEELFSMFNILYHANKQIVLAADQPPKSLVHIESRLISRFSGGLVVDIQPPEMEMRIAILMKKASLIGFHLPENIALYVAERVSGNVRLLEGALKSLIFYSSMKSQPLTVAFAEKAIQPIIGTLETSSTSSFFPMSHPRLTMDDLTHIVADFFGISSESILSKSHRPKIVLPRQIVMYLARYVLHATLIDIGNHFGKHHTTVMHAIQKIETMAEDNTHVRQQLDHLMESLKPPGSP